MNLNNVHSSEMFSNFSVDIFSKHFQNVFSLKLCHFLTVENNIDSFEIKSLNPNYSYEKLIEKCHYVSNFEILF